MEKSEQVIFFNSMYDVGALVIYWPIMNGLHRKGKRVFTESKAGIIGNNAVVFVSDIGNVSIDNVQHGLHGLEKNSLLFDSEYKHKW